MQSQRIAQLQQEILSDQEYETLVKGKQQRVLIYQTDESSLFYLSLCRSAVRLSQLLLLGYSVRIGTFDSFKLQEYYTTLRNCTCATLFLNLAVLGVTRQMRNNFVIKIEFDTVDQTFYVQ